MCDGRRISDAKRAKLLLWVFSEAPAVCTVVVGVSTQQQQKGAQQVYQRRAASRGVFPMSAVSGLQRARVHHNILGH